MPDRDEIMGSCISDLKEMESDPDVTLLDRIVEELMPGIQDQDERRVAASDGDELERIRRDFLMGRLGLEDSPSLMGAIQKVIRHYGRSESAKLRPVVYYMLVKEFGREDAFAK